MKNIIQKIKVWFLYSSIDPTKTSLTLKAMLLAFVPTVILLAQLLHWNWSADQAVALIQQITAIVSISLTVIGLIRKIYYTIFPLNTTV